MHRERVLQTQQGSCTCELTPVVAAPIGPAQAQAKENLAWGGEYEVPTPPGVASGGGGKGSFSKAVAHGRATTLQ